MMKNLLLQFLLLAFALTQSVPAQAGDPPSLLKRLGTKLDSMSVKGLDRRYIDAPKRPWQLMLKGNVNQSSVKMKTSGSIAGEAYSASPFLKTEPAYYVGAWVGYRGYGVGYTVNVAGDKGNYLTFGATGGSYGLNVRFHSFENSDPKFGLNSSLIPDEDKSEWDKVHLTSPIKVKTIIADAYYMFNGKRFSYAAAYDYSVLQKRSAGSFMVGAMFYYGHINYANNSNADLIYVMHGLGGVKLWQGSAGVGYAYNWVPCKGLLISAMAMPMLTFVNRIRAYGYDTNVPELMEDPRFFADDISNAEWDKWFYSNTRITPIGHKSFNSNITLNFDARLSVTYNFGRYFLSAYGQFNNFRYHHSSSSGRLNDWFVNTAFGVRL